MKVIETPLQDLVLIQPDVYRDDRGFFLETYHQLRYSKEGLPATFVQDNHSQSSKGTLRGLHAQLEKPQAKLVRALRGRIWDVAVDIRRGSSTYKRWHSVELSEQNLMQVFVPAGFAHGFYTLSDVADVEYKCTEFYHPETEVHILWNDPAIGIAWPVVDPVLSPKDAKGVLLSEVESRLPWFSKK